MPTTQTLKEYLASLTALGSADTAADFLAILDTDADALKKILPEDLGITGGGGSALVYAARLAQTGTGNPTATVGENTLGGTVVWTRESTGLYRGTLTGAWAGTCVPLVSYDFGGACNHAYIDKFSDNIMQVITTTAAGGQEDIDGGVVHVYILVYP